MTVPENGPRGTAPRTGPTAEDAGPALFGPDDAERYLAARGLAADGAPVRAAALGGGVSNLVYAVSAGTRRYVLKQSLPRLRVADDWQAPRARIIAEAKALQLAATITPDAVPPLVSCDEAALVIVIDHAPDGWAEWKQALLAGQVDPGVGRRLGEILAAWHSATPHGRRLPPLLRDVTAFEALRVDPFYRTVARRRPELAGPVNAYADQMAGRRICLVHGDFSPKNVLTAVPGARRSAKPDPAAPPGAPPGNEPPALWVTDFEVAHLGDPAFDLAFLISHLALKTVHRPANAAGYRRCAEEFLSAYQNAVAPALASPADYLFGHVACLLAARVDGKSPAEYLTAAGQRTVRELVPDVLARPPRTAGELWRALGGTAR